MRECHWLLRGKPQLCAPPRGKSLRGNVGVGRNYWVHHRARSQFPVNAHDVPQQAMVMMELTMVMTDLNMPMTGMME